MMLQQQPPPLPAGSVAGVIGGPLGVCHNHGPYRLLRQLGRAPSPSAARYSATISITAAAHPWLAERSGCGSAGEEQQGLQALQVEWMNR